MKIVDTRKPKLCFAKPGSVVQLLDEDQAPTGDFYLVTVVDIKGKRAGRNFVPHGLYDEERPLFLVSLETGQAIPMPHLSSRVEIVREAKLVIAAD